MAKANIVLPNGSKVDIEGTPEEINQILGVLGNAAPKEIDKRHDPSLPAKIPKSKEKIGLTGLILELKTHGFFKEKRSLSEIRERLESEGYIYPNTTVAPILIRLIKSRELGRVREDGAWKYVNR